MNNIENVNDLSIAFQIQQLEEYLDKTKEEVSQLKFDLQENVELVSFPSPHYLLITTHTYWDFYGLDFNYNAV